MQQNTITAVNNFLTEAGVFWLATTDGPQPKARPLGLHLDMDGRLLFTVGDYKEVFRQLKANPLIEIVAINAQNDWLRLTGTAVEENADDEARYQALCLAQAPYLAAEYNDETGHKMAFFHITEAHAAIYGIDGSIKEL